MADFHGIIFAYRSQPQLGDLVRSRTSSSLPFCGRYRLIDFALSSLSNAGVYDVGVVMQRDYQSLLDHLGGGKDWGMSRRNGGLRMLPPFGLPNYHTGEYSGIIEALSSILQYLKDIPQKNIILMPGNAAANYDLDAAIKSHIASNCQITAICAKNAPSYPHTRFVVEDGLVKEMLVRTEKNVGLASAEVYIISKQLLIEQIEKANEEGKNYYHTDVMLSYVLNGGKVNAVVHEGYSKIITTVQDYFTANMDMLDKNNNMDLFPPSRPVRTKNHEEASTYYGENSSCVNSLVADGCIINGSVENCIVFPEVRVSDRAELKNCIIMKSSVVGEGAQLDCVIADKYTEFSDYITLVGSKSLPIVAPKGSKV